MIWRKKPPPIPLIYCESVSLDVLSPRLAGIIKACLGKLEPAGLDQKEREQLQALYDALPGVSYTLFAKGLYSDYGAPVEYIRAVPPNPKRK